MSLLTICLLGVIQGFAELLPVSSSAHVIVAEKLLGLDPSSPELTFLLAMLHTGTMVAVLVYFWPSWRLYWDKPKEERIELLKMLGLATVTTGIVGFSLIRIIERILSSDGVNFSVESIFGNLTLISISVFTVGVFIIYSDWTQQRSRQINTSKFATSIAVGAIQGLCLPFRGLSRSGATISMGMVFGFKKLFSEHFSFALAIILTPPVIARELKRLLENQSAYGTKWLSFSTFGPGLLGLIVSFIAGSLAIRWLSSWVEKGRWHLFGYYCLVFSIFVFWIGHR